MARPHDPDQPGYEIREAQERVAQQKALVRRRIVQGTPTQGLEDQLRHLERVLLRMKEQRGQTRTSEIQRKMRYHRSR
jgi:hypothetical protein